MSIVSVWMDCYGYNELDCNLTSQRNWIFRYGTDFSNRIYSTKLAQTLNTYFNERKSLTSFELPIIITDFGNSLCCLRKEEVNHLLSIHCTHTYTQRHSLFTFGSSSMAISIVCIILVLNRIRYDDSNFGRYRWKLYILKFSFQCAYISLDALKAAF